MAEYIEREEAIKAIAEDKIEMTPELIAIGRAIGTYTAEQAFDGINQACDRHIESIKIIPTADVQPVKHGENIGTDYAECDQFVCSRCGIELQRWVRVERDEDDGDETYHEYIFNFCPNCGARMDGES